MARALTREIPPDRASGAGKDRGRTRRRRHRLSVVLGVVLLAGSTPLRAEVTLLDNAALERLLERGVPVIDIRTPEEWRETGVIEGSHLLTFFDAQGRFDFRAWLTELAGIASRNEPFALICDSGGRTGLISQILDVHLGYERVHDVPGGIAQWVMENQPTVEPGDQ